MPHLTTWQHVQRCASNLAPKASVRSGHAVRHAPCAVLASDLANAKARAPLASARQRQPFYSVCTSSAQRQSTPSTHSACSSERRLVAQLHRLSQTGAQAQREAVWGLYQRLGREHIDIHTFAQSTVLRLLELLAGDDDELQALARITAVVKAISIGRRLSEQEVQRVQQICGDIDEGRQSNISRSQVGNSEGLSLDRPALGSTRSGDLATLPPQFSSEPATRLGDTCADVAQLRRLLSSPPITVDPTQIWTLYRSAINAGLADGRKRLAREDMRDLVIYCGSLGSIAGRRFLAQIEADAIADPLLYPTRFRVLLTTYAKLGLLDDARRCYQDALRSDFIPLTHFEDFSMCQALLRSSRHKEGRILFDKLVRAGQARSFMYDMLIREYVLTKNTEVAFALFGDMLSRDIEPTLDCFCVLASACSLDRDSDRGSKRLSDLVACMKSWGRAPNKRFFVAILKGYHWSGQYSMFDGLLQRLRAHGLGSDSMLGKAVMENAAERMNPDLAVAMARVAVQSPANIPKVVQVLSRMGLTSELAECVDLSQYPANNLTANARLCVLLSRSEMAANPRALVDEVINMVKREFTPSFQLFFHVISHIRLHGNLQLAIQTYTTLAAAGVPKSIELLFFALQMHLEARDSEASIATYEELRERLRDSDFTKLRIRGPTMESLMLTLIECRGIAVAREALGFLSGLPVNRHYLPYSPLIEYYVNSKMADEAHGLVSYVIQHDISLRPRAINLYSRYLASRSATTDLANFLRYAQRTRSLHAVADDVFGTFFALCAFDHKVADLEWIVGAMSSMRQCIGAWSAAFEQLAEADPQLLQFVVYTAISLSSNPGRTAVDMLGSIAKSPFRETVADLVLTTLEAHGTMPPRLAYESALTIFTQSWMANHSSSKKTTDMEASRELVLKALRRHIAPAVKAQISPSLLAIAMQALSSRSRSAYKECLDFLSALPSELVDSRLYCAIAGTCSRQGLVVGVDSVLEAMRQRDMLLTDFALTSLLFCYVNLKPPRKMALESWRLQQPLSTPTTPGLQLDTLRESEPATDVVLPGSSDFATGGALPADSTPTAHDAFEDDPAWIGESNASGDTGFYLATLGKILSIWKELEYLDIPIGRRGYAAIARAHIKAGKHKEAEAFFVEMVNRGIPHSEISAVLWIRSRAMQNDIGGALEILGAIGNATRCAALSASNWCFNSLDMVPLTSRHFSVIAWYYLNQGDLVKALAIISAMHRRELAADTQLYAEVLWRLTRSDNHELLVDLLRQIAKVGASIDAHIMDIIKEYSANRRALTSTGTTNAKGSGSEAPGEHPKD
ncbi:hypothetical protein IWW57_002097 [Coemansia sp. S610]|nr:hypothetical protein IWW57_002097 [Coemansia sp. S610]